MPHAPASSTHWRIPEHIVHTQMGAEGVLLDLRTKQYYSLNATGTVIWTMTGDGCGEDEIAAAICARFEVEEDQARAHVAAFVRELCESGLLVSDRDAE